MKRRDPFEVLVCNWLEEQQGNSLAMVDDARWLAPRLAAALCAKGLTDEDDWAPSAVVGVAKAAGLDLEAI